jgi:hypothetical protein
MENYLKPSYEMMKWNTEKKLEESRKIDKDAEEYEETICECPMTGTIEIMRRKVEK